MNQYEQMGMLVGAGAIAAVGKLLIGNTPLCWRTLLGTLIVGGCLGTLAAIALLWLPEMPFIIQVAMASGISTLGYKLFENTYEAVIFKLTGKDIDQDKKVP